MNTDRLYELSQYPGSRMFFAYLAGYLQGDDRTVNTLTNALNEWERIMGVSYKDQA